MVVPAPANNCWFSKIEQAFLPVFLGCVGPGCAPPNPIGEMLGNRYVYSRKPSPNFLSGANPDWQAAEADMRKTRAATKNCNVELLFRDLYTVDGDRCRVAKWVEMTKAVFEC